MTVSLRCPNCQITWTRLNFYYLAGPPAEPSLAGPYPAEDKIEHTWQGPSPVCPNCVYASETLRGLLTELVRNELAHHLTFLDFLIAGGWIGGPADGVRDARGVSQELGDG